MTNQPKRPQLVQRLKDRLRANPKVALVDLHLPLSNGTETPLLKDVLEENVDEKYYLDHKVVSRIISEISFKERLVSIKIDKEKK